MTIFREEKPLFVPLATEHFNSFYDGSKDTEMRVYGKRWNEKTCRLGRLVTLSKGYGKWSRINARIVSFRKMEWETISENNRATLEACGIKNKPIAYIGIQKI